MIEEDKEGDDEDFEDVGEAGQTLGEERLYVKTAEIKPTEISYKRTSIRLSDG